MTVKRFALLAVPAVLTGLVFAAKAGAPAGDNPLPSFAFAAGETRRFDGRVVGRAAAGSYVYLEVERDGGARSWVVTLASSAGAARDVGSVHVVAVGHASHFFSKRLSRSFDDLYFAVVRPA
jgi:hypothetical protein